MGRPLLLYLLLILLMPAQAAAVEGTLTSVEHCKAALQTDPSPGPALPDTLRLVTWNVMKLDRPQARELATTLGRDADLMLLQESPVEFSLYADVDGDHFAPGYQRRNQLTGVSLHSPLMVDTRCTLSFREPWLRTPKAVLAVRIAGSRQNLLVVNLHGINFTLGSGAYRRQLQAIAELVRAHEGPAIVAGDFNHWNPWRRGVLEEFRASLGLDEVSFAPDWRSRHLGSPVDGAFVRGLRVISATAYPTSRSDHNPIGLTLETASPVAADNPG